MKLTESKLKKLILEVLLETKWPDKGSQGGKDVDFPKPNDGVVFFNPDSKYELDGSPTHNVTSHVIKHSTDTGLKSDINTGLTNFKKILKTYMMSGGKVFYNKEGKAQELTMDNIDSLNRGDFKNTLDRINDDLVNKNKILDIEQKIDDLLLPAENKYIKMSNDTVKDPDATASAGKKKTFVKDDKIVIAYDDKIVSMFGNKKFRKDPTSAAAKYAQSAKKKNT